MTDARRANGGFAVNALGRGISDSATKRLSDESEADSS
ncbi:hypothetical protein ATKI12_6270 [Kitasatospora sp. Ki12]